MILCDVSDSVRVAARFMLEFVCAAQELFDRTRSFVFVSELAETTELFEALPAGSALDPDPARRGGEPGAQLELRARPAGLRGATRA